MSFTKTVITIQQALLDSEIKFKLEHYPSGDGNMASDFIVNDPKVKLEDLKRLLSDVFKSQPEVGGLWRSADDNTVFAGLDFQDASKKTWVIQVERHCQINDGKKMKSFKAFLNEARKAGVNIQEEKTKGIVTKLIATLESHEASQFTKVARQYHSIMKALTKLEEKKAELNANLKATIGSTFDPELDKFTTRVVQSAKFAASLAKETHPDDVKEKVEVNYEQLIEGLLKLIKDDLKPQADELIIASTRKWKPDPKSPNLSVKSLEEGVAETVTSWYRSFKVTLQSIFSRFDKNLASLEKQLAKYKST